MPQNRNPQKTHKKTQKKHNNKKEKNNLNQKKNGTEGKTVQKKLSQKSPRCCWAPQIIFFSGEIHKNNFSLLHKNKTKSAGMTKNKPNVTLRAGQNSLLPRCIWHGHWQFEVTFFVRCAKKRVFWLFFQRVGCWGWRGVSGPPTIKMGEKNESCVFTPEPLKETQLKKEKYFCLRRVG